MSFLVDSIKTKRYSIQFCVYLHDDFFLQGVIFSITDYAVLANPPAAKLCTVLQTQEP